MELLSESAQGFEAAILCLVLMGNHFQSGRTDAPNHGCTRSTEAASAITVVFGATSAHFDAGDFKEPYR